MDKNKHIYCAGDKFQAFTDFLSQSYGVQWFPTFFSKSAPYMCIYQLSRSNVTKISSRTISS